jgi:hypothetical protein
METNGHEEQKEQTEEDCVGGTIALEMSAQQ